MEDAYRDSQNTVFMTLQLLKDLPTLQIPYINLMIFAPAHNIFPVRDAKAGE
jgi:hypothetical protein